MSETLTEHQLKANWYCDDLNVPAANIVGGYVSQARGFYDGRPMTAVVTEDTDEKAIERASEAVRKEIAQYGPISKEVFPDEKKWEIRVWKP